MSEYAPLPVVYEREPMPGTIAAKVACWCPKGARFHALNCSVRPGEYMTAYVERLEQRLKLREEER